MLAVVVLAEALTLVIVVAAAAVVAADVFLCGTGVQKNITRRYTCKVAALSETGAAYKPHRSLRLPFIRAGIAPDRLALSIVVVVELPFARRVGQSQTGELAQVHTPCPSGWRRAQAQRICCPAHEGMYSFSTRKGTLSETGAEPEHFLHL